MLIGGPLTLTGRPEVAPRVHSNLACSAAGNTAKSRRPRRSQELPACRVMAVPNRLFSGTLRILVLEARLPAF